MIIKQHRKSSINSYIDKLEVDINILMKHGRIEMNRSSLLKRFSVFVNHIPFLNTISGKWNNKVSVQGLIFRTKIKVVGEGNIIVIVKNALLYKSTILVHGNNNYIEIGEHAQIKCAHFHFEDDNNKIFVGSRTAMCGNINIACLEGTSINIGTDCLFSAGIEIRTSDSHSILNMLGERLNCAKSIVIGDHVWCGQNVFILKGAHIEGNTVIGACSVVNKKILEGNCVVAGNPAKTVKRGIVWNKERIKHDIRLSEE